MRSRIALVLVCLVVLFPGNSAAQGTNATLSGTVIDPGGAVIPGATVTALNVPTGVSQSTISNESGIYIFPSLQPGTYRVTVEMTGFQKLVYETVKLEVAARVNLNLPMQLGARTESIEVRAKLETSLGYVTSSIGGMVTGQMVRDLLWLLIIRTRLQILSLRDRAGKLLSHAQDSDFVARDPVQ